MPSEYSAENIEQHPAIIATFKDGSTKEYGDRAKRNTVPAPVPGVYMNVPEDTYHRWNALNASTIKPFLKSGHHGALYIGGHQSPPSAEMLFGSALHARVLEPDRYKADAFDGYHPKDKGKILADSCVHWKHKDVEELNPGKIILHNEWAEKIEAMALMIESHPVAKTLIHHKEAMNEVSIVWVETFRIEDVEFRVLCKARLDRLIPSIHAIPDVKTTNEQNENPTNYRRHITKLGYDISFAWYTRARVAHGLIPDYPENPNSALGAIVAAITTPPHIVNVYPLKRADLDHAWSRIIGRGIPSYIRFLIDGTKTPMFYPEINEREDGKQHATSNDPIDYNVPYHLQADQQGVTLKSIGETP